MTVAKDDDTAVQPLTNPTPRANPFSTIDGSSWGGAALSAAVGYGAGLAIAIITIVVTAMLAGWNLDGQWIFAGPVQLVAMSLFGSLSASVSVETGWFPVSGTGSVTVIPILVTAAVSAGIWFWSRRAARGKQAPLQTRLVLSLATGATLAVSTTIIAAVLPFSTPKLMGLPGDAIGMSASAASVGGFFGALVVGFAVSFLARQSTSSGSLPAWVPIGTVRVAATHFAILIAFAAILALFVVPTLSDGAFVALPLLLPTIAIALVIVSLLGSLGVTGTDFGGFLSNLGMGSSTPPSVSLGSELLPGYAWLLLVVAVLAAVIASCLLRVRRAGTPLQQKSWWITPLAYALIGLLLQALTAIQLQVSVSMFGEQSASATVGAAAWTFLLFGIWGLAVEAGSRYAAPYVLAVAGAGTLSVMSKLVGRDSATVVSTETSDAPASAAAPQSPAAEVAPVTESAAAVPAAAPAPLTVSLSAQAKRRIKLGIILGASAAVLIVAVVVTGNIVRDTVFGPSATARQYFSALESGNASEALDLLGMTEASDDALLNNDAFGAAKNRITAVGFGEVTVNGDLAIVEVSYKQAGERYTEYVELTRTGTSFLIVDEWIVANAAPVSVTVSTPWMLRDVEQLQLGNTTIEIQETMTFPSFPGTYEFTIPASKYFEATKATYTVNGLTSNTGSSFAEREFAAVTTQSVEDDAMALVVGGIEDCAARTTDNLEDCPFPGPQVWAGEVTAIKYTVTRMPELELELGDGSIVVSSVSNGEVSYDYTWVSSWGGTVNDDGHKTSRFNVYAQLEIVDGELTLVDIY